MRSWFDKTRGLLLAMILLLVISAGWLFLTDYQQVQMITMQGETALNLFSFLIVGFILSLFLARSIRKRILIYAGSVIAAIYAANLVLMIETHEVMQNPRGEEDRKIDVLLDLQRAGVDAVPYIYTHIYPSSRGRVIVSAGVSNEVTVLCKEKGLEWSIYRSDDYGFNNPPDVWRRPVEIAVLGDSFTHGACVAQDETWPAILREPYPSTLNLAISNSGPLEALVILREYVTELKPRIVIWTHYTGNDLNDVYRGLHASKGRNQQRSEFTPYLQDKSFKTGLMDIYHDEINDQIRQKAKKLQAEEKKQFDQTKSTINFTTIISDMILLRSMRFATNFALTMDPRRPRRGGNLLSQINRESRQALISSFLSIISSMKETVESWDGKFVVVLINRWDKSYGHFIKGGDELPEVIEGIKDITPDFIDTGPLLMNHPDVESLYPGKEVGRYFNAKGYRLIGEFVADYISKLPLDP